MRPLLFAVVIFYHFGPRIINLQIKKFTLDSKFLIFYHFCKCEKADKNSTNNGVCLYFIYLQPRLRTKFNRNNFNWFSFGYDSLFRYNYFQAVFTIIWTAIEGVNTVKISKTAWFNESCLHAQARWPNGQKLVANKWTFHSTEKSF
jgi:hypothetical protein